MNTLKQLKAEIEVNNKLLAFYETIPLNELQQDTIISIHSMKTENNALKKGISACEEILNQKEKDNE